MTVVPINDRARLIEEAAAWLRRQSPRPSPVVPALRERYGLSALEAVQAIRTSLAGGRTQ